MGFLIAFLWTDYHLLYFYYSLLLAPANNIKWIGYRHSMINKPLVRRRSKDFTEVLGKALVMELNRLGFSVYQCCDPVGVYLTFFILSFLICKWG